MSIQLSDRVQSIQPSATLAATSRAAELRAQGHDIIGLDAGQPDFDTPAHIKAAAAKALDEGFTKYTVVDGMVELREAVCRKLKRDNGLDYQADQILVSCGAKHSLFNIMQALLNDGDEAVIPAPYWVSYPDMVGLCGGVPVTIQTSIETNFKISPEQLEAAITPKTRMLLLNSPSNPSGVCYRRSDLEALGEVLRQHPQVAILSDDIYELIYWADEPFCNIAMACPDLYDRTIVINGMSKGYAMTGWRIGYTATGPEFTRAMKKVQGQSTSCPSSISQVAAIAALNGDHQVVRDMAVDFKRRHDYVVERLNRGNGVRCLAAEGAFYAFPDVSGAIEAMDGCDNDLQLAEQLIEKHGVALVAGSAFGAPGCVRLSYAISDDRLAQALDRIEAALAG